MNIILNEVDEARNRINNNILGQKPSETLSLLARYYRQIERLSEKETIKKLNDFMIQNCEMYNEVKWRDSITRYTRSAKKYPLNQIDGVTVSDNELAKIHELGAIRVQRLMFTLLCLAKFQNQRNASNNNWVTRKYSELFSLAHINATQKQQSVMLSELYKLGYISFSNRITNLNIHVEIIDSDENGTHKVADFRDLGYEYMLLSGEKDFMRCQCCNLVIKRHRNVQKYCKPCARIMHKH